MCGAPNVVGAVSLTKCHTRGPQGIEMWPTMHRVRAALGGQPASCVKQSGLNQGHIRWRTGVVADEKQSGKGCRNGPRTRTNSGQTTRSLLPKEQAPVRPIRSVMQIQWHSKKNRIRCHTPPARWGPSEIQAAKSTGSRGTPGHSSEMGRCCACPRCSRQWGYHQGGHGRQPWCRPS